MRFVSVLSIGLAVVACCMPVLSRYLYANTNPADDLSFIAIMAMPVLLVAGLVLGMIAHGRMQDAYSRTALWLNAVLFFAMVATVGYFLLAYAGR